jgi:hypothetical protein
LSEIKLSPDAQRPGRAAFTTAPEFITLDEAETLALATGQHRGMTVEFSDDGTTWVDAWVPTEGHTAPQLARAIVTRKYGDGDEVRTPSVLRWAEYVPDITDPRHDEWLRMPTMYLGKCAKVSAYRGGFRDVIGNRYEPAELHQSGMPTPDGAAA